MRASYVKTYQVGMNIVHESLLEVTVLHVENGLHEGIVGLI